MIYSLLNVNLREDSMREASKMGMVSKGLCSCIRLVYISYCFQLYIVSVCIYYVYVVVHLYLFCVYLQ